MVGLNMFSRYRRRIEKYCQGLGIEIPVGFWRHDADRYAAIDLASSPPRLIATCWSREQDAVKFFSNWTAAQRFKLLDFEENRELTISEQKHFVKGASF